jgi:hypothetical protein
MYNSLNLHKQEAKKFGVGDINHGRRSHWSHTGILAEINQFDTSTWRQGNLVYNY